MPHDSNDFYVREIETRVPTRNLETVCEPSTEVEESGTMSSPFGSKPAIGPISDNRFVNEVN